MDKVETAELLTVASATDGRRVTDITVAAWYEVTRHLDYEVAREALRRAKADASISFIEPKHILSYAKIVRRDQEREDRRLEQREPEQGAPKPKNFEAMIDAYRSGDPVAIAKEVSAYERQLAEAGYSDQWTETHRVDFRTPRY